jgi:hypothetical protein
MKGDGRAKLKAALLQRDFLELIADYAKGELKRGRGRPASMKADMLQVAAADVRRLRRLLKEKGISYRGRGNELVAIVHDRYKRCPWPFTEEELESQLKRPINLRTK